MKKFLLIICTLVLFIAINSCTTPAAVNETETETVVETSQVFSIAFQYQNYPNANYVNCKDSYIRSGGYADTNYNASTDLYVGRFSNSTTARALLFFNIESYIPYNAVVKSAYLSLHSAGSGYINKTTAGIYSVNSFFNDGQVTWNNRESGPGGIWTSGGDFGTKNLLLDSKAGGIFNNFSLDPSVVQSWVLGSNNGIIIKANDETGTENRNSYFRSNSYSEPCERPKLTIYYTLP